MRYIAGLAGKYFKMMDVTGVFKQKIFIRAKFMAHYSGIDNTKMRSR